MAELRARPALSGSWRWCPRCQFKFKVPSVAEAEHLVEMRRAAGEYAFRDTSQPPPEYVSVRCRVCGTAIDATLEQVGQEIACPDCGTLATVTPPPPPSPKPPPAPICEEIYELCEGVNQPDASHKLVYQTYLRVVCPTCGSSILATLDQVGEEVVCPDCLHFATVPPPAEPKKPPSPSGVEHRRDDEYTLAPGVDQPAPLATAEINVRCPHCQTLLPATIDQVGTEIVCHDCGKTLLVPERNVPTSPLPPEHSLSDEFAVGTAIVLPEYRHVKDYRTLDVDRGAGRTQSSPTEDEGSVGQAQGSSTTENRAASEPARDDTADGASGADREDDDSLPPKPLAADLMRFLFQEGVWQRWLALSATVVPLALYWALAASVGMALAAFAIVATLFWVVPAAAIVLAVVDDTSAGADRVEHWPEAIVGDWLLHVLLIFNSLGAAVFAGRILRGIVREYGGLDIGLIYPLVTHLAFPILLLSMMETGSALNPYSPPVWRTVRSAWKEWAAFYIRSALVLGATWAAAVGVYGLGGLWGAAFVTPLLVAAAFLYARLLGRLGWQAQRIARKQAAEESERTA